MTIRCEACGTVIAEREDDSAPILGGDYVIPNMLAAGAVNVTVAVSTGPWTRGETPLFVRGGWLCRKCARKYVAARPKKVCARFAPSGTPDVCAECRHPYLDHPGTSRDDR